MKRILPVVLIVTALGVSLPATGARDGRPVTFDAKNALELVKMLAGDSMEGRKSGLPGGNHAARAVAEKLAGWGLRPGGGNGTFFQEFPLENLFVVNKAALEIVAGGATRSFTTRNGLFDEWRVCENSGSGAVRGEIVLAGYGLRAPEKGYDDYAGIDVRGKVVLIVMGFPPALAPIVPQDSLSSEGRIRAARALGAAAVLIAPDPAPIGRANFFPAWGQVDRKDYDPAFVAVGINEAVVSFITDGLPIDPRVHLASLQADKKGRPVATGIEARIEVRTTFAPKTQAVNVLARIPGSDRKLRDEVVLLGAHMDGLGVAPDGEVCNGANDNASGAAVVMEAARAMAASGYRPKRTIVFALWGAEEIGLFGSLYYTEHPVDPLAKTVANINLDMVGQGSSGKIGLGGIYFATEAYDFLKTAVPPEIMAGMSPYRGVGGSDHLSFLAKGVPALHMVGFGDHLKTHTPRDDDDLIKPELLDKAGRFLVSAATALADARTSLVGNGREALTKFRYEDALNCVVLPFADAAARWKDVVNPDVDYQLVAIDPPAGATPAEARLAAGAALDSAPAKVAGGPGPMVVLGQEPNPATRPAGRGVTLIVGLGDAAFLRDDPDWIRQADRFGLKFLRVRDADLEMSGEALAEPSKRLLEAADRTKVIVILDVVAGPEAAAASAALKRPAVFVTTDLPAGNDLETFKATPHVLALRWAAGTGAGAYFERLKAARAALAPERVMAWNERDLWSAEGKADYVKLTALMMREGWDKETPFMSRRSGLSAAWTGNFLRLLRGY